MVSYVLEKKGGKLFSNVNIADKVALLPDGKYEIEINKLYKTRTLKQDRWYKKVLLIVAKELGYTEEEMDETFRFAFLSNDVKNTENLTTVQMSKFFEDICRFSAGYGIFIPDPGDYEAGPIKTE